MLNKANDMILFYEFQLPRLVIPVTLNVKISKTQLFA